MEVDGQKAGARLRMAQFPSEEKEEKQIASNNLINKIDEEDEESHIFLGGFPPGFQPNLPSSLNQMGFFSGCMDVVSA